jgi:hypothetical protein
MCPGAVQSIGQMNYRVFVAHVLIASGLVLTGCRSPSASDRGTASLLSTKRQSWNEWTAWPERDASQVHLARRGTTVLRVETDVIGENDAGLTKIGWVRMVPDAPPFLVIVSDSGGAHCCGRAWVIEPQDPPQLVFDSAWYGPDGRLQLQDLDGDTVLEIVQNLTTFHYYDGICYADSPNIDAVFAWDTAAHRFVPANDRFPSLWQAVLDESRNGTTPDTIVPAPETAEEFFDRVEIRSQEALVVGRAANLVYAGHIREAFEWLERQFDPENGRRVCQVLREYLAADNYFRCLNGLPMMDREEALIGRVAGEVAKLLWLVRPLEGSTNSPPSEPSQVGVPAEMPERPSE